MFSTLLSVSLFLALFHSVSAQSTFSIATPSLVQCQTAEIYWTDTGNGPYDLLVASAQDMCGVAVEDLGSQNCTAVTWTVNLAAGTEVLLYIEDADGDSAWSGNITVGDSNDTSCLSSTSTPSPTTPPTSTPPASPPPTPTPSVSGTPPGIPPAGGVPPPSSPSPSSSPLSPAGAANAGLGTSGALSTRPLSAITLFISVLVVAFTL